MKKTTLLIVATALILALSVTLVYAQGRGQGNLRIGQPCPLGYTEPNPNPPGWWTQVQPTTPEQQAFLDRAAEIHKQIREKQFEADRLRATGGDPTVIANLEQQVQQLRAENQQFMLDNWEIRRQMGVRGRGRGMMRQNWQPGMGAGQNWQPGMGQGFRGGRGGAMRGAGAGAWQGQQRPMGINPYCPLR